MKIQHVHELKILEIYFVAVISGLKNFEIRKNDRNFHVGDVLVLKEYNSESNRYSGRKVIKQVKYIFNGPGYGIEDGYCVLALGELAEEQLEEIRKEVIN